MEPLDLFSAITDMDDQDVLEALDVYTREPKRRKARGMIAVAVTFVALVSIGIVTFWALQKEKGNSDGTSKLGDEYSLGIHTPTNSVEKNPSTTIGELPVCGIYQFMLWGETEYRASVEDCDRIGAEIGSARVRNEERVSEKTLFKDVVVYEIIGMDPAIAVLVYYPEEQEYYVYYNSTY